MKPTAKIWAIAGILILLAFLPAVAGAPAVLAESQTEKITYVVEGSELMGGGTVVGLRVRDITFGVLFGDANHTNSVTVFTGTTRYFGGAELYDTNGNYLGKRGIPITTICAQRFDFLGEFQRQSPDHLFSPVERIKGINLNGTWEFANLTKVIDDVNRSADITFTLSRYNLTYTQLNGGTPEGVLEKISLTFHLHLSIENKTITDVPWYKVTVDRRDNNKIVDSEFLRYENYTAGVVNGSFKYDHLIEGWDFATNRSALAMGTTVVVLNYVHNKVAEWLHAEYGKVTGNAENETVANESAGPSSPRAITRDSITFRDNWQRIGVFRWVSNVTVDGIEKPMLFQVHGWERLAFQHANGNFRGFGVKGAYLYPQGTTIYHDPGLSAEAALFTIHDIDARTMFRIVMIAGVFAVAVAGLAAIAYIIIRKRK
ncbi:MAG: hypothetical protein N3F63_07900 [Thermoplasmata archaeon]|nr:hypothetical protein [Thermoplasmata archaeon]